METGITLPGRKAVAAKLQTLLADEFILYTKTRNTHWNVEGINFSELHKLYEEQYKALEITIDEIAERIRMIGFNSPGTLSAFLKLTHLKEQDVTNSPNEQLEYLLNDHETIIRFIRDSIQEIMEEHKDFGSADFVTGIMQQHEKMSWMLRSLLKQNFQGNKIAAEKKRIKELV